MPPYKQNPLKLTEKQLIEAALASPKSLKRLVKGIIIEKSTNINKSTREGIYCWVNEDFKKFITFSLIYIGLVKSSPWTLVNNNPNNDTAY